MRGRPSNSHDAFCLSSWVIDPVPGLVSHRPEYIHSLEPVRRGVHAAASAGRPPGPPSLPGLNAPAGSLRVCSAAPGGI